MKNLNIHDESFLSLNDLNLPPIEKKLGKLLAFREEEFSALSSKNKVADEKKLAQSGIFERFKYTKLSLRMFNFFKLAFQYDYSCNKTKQNEQNLLKSMANAKIIMITKSLPPDKT